LGSAWALEAADELTHRGLETAVLHVSTIKPLDQDAIGSFCGSYDVVNTFENHSRTGSLGTAVAEVLAESGSRTRLRRLEVPDAWADRWTTSLGLDAVSARTLADCPSRRVHRAGRCRGHGETARTDRLPVTQQCAFLGLIMLRLTSCSLPRGR